MCLFTLVLQIFEKQLRRKNAQHLKKNVALLKAENSFGFVSLFVIATN